MSKALLALGATLCIAAGGFAAAAFSVGSAPTPTRTVTINLKNGATGPAGPRGPTGPAGAIECPTGFDPGNLVINHPGGQVTIFTCLKTP